MFWKRGNHQAEATPLRSAAAADSTVEARTQTLGRALLEAMTRHEKGLLDKGFWSSRLMDWAMQAPEARGRLFQLVDVFPVLQDPQALAQHIREYLLEGDVKLPAGMQAALKAGSLMPSAMAAAMGKQIEAMAGQFIAGSTPEEALPGLAQRWKQGMAFSLDLLGEACVSDAEAEAYQQRYLQLIEEVADAAAAWPEHPLLERHHLGAVPRVNVSIKVTSLAPVFDPIAPQASIERVMARLSPILQTAGRRGVLINFDMEHAALKDLTLDLFMHAAETHDFHAGIALQAYLRSGPADARKLIDWSQRTGRLITVRLVKGAYWNQEIAHAQSQHWPVPVWTQKQASDACFEQMAGMLIEACPKQAGQGGILPAIGSHNVRSIAAAWAMLEHAGLPASALELQMLRGMADALKLAAIDQGLRVREYVPVGELIPGMAYLVRRLLENTSNQSWLLGHSVQGLSAEQLLAPPAAPDHETLSTKELHSPEYHALSDAVPGVGDGRAFLNEPLRDFSQPDQREAFAQAVAASALMAVDVNQATAVDARRAIDAAQQAFPAWSQTSVRERAAAMIRTADLMRQRRDELAGIIIRESAKPWRSADADVCEAIDFLNYYARQAVALFEGQSLGRYLLEHNTLFHRARGVAAIISPWNFPLAICTGMTAAALVTGNPAIVKPAEQSSWIARVMVDLFHEAGVAESVVQWLPGRGEVVGAALSQDPRVAIIAFTGSRDVGVELQRIAGTTQPGQTQARRLICEMGGKNAIIVDTSADPDLAVLAVRESAFGYSGQKCSACSRVIVVGDGHDRFVERLAAATAALTLGDPMNPQTDLGPVIDDDAAAKIWQYIDIGRREGTLVYAGQVPEAIHQHRHRYVPPHIFTGIRPEHRLAREEIFGPVLAVMHAQSFEQAVAMANDSQYRLTGGVISRTPSHLAYARQHFAVGNLYLNRTITGALVGRQPFGGFGMSGIGEKAGGPAYLRQFVDSTVCTENTFRSGFSPEVIDLTEKGPIPGM